MKSIVILTLFLLLGCNKKSNHKEGSDVTKNLTNTRFSQFDQITVLTTASPLNDSIAYNVKIKNIGFSIIEGISEVRQQWQPLKKKTSNLDMWNEFIPAASCYSIPFKLKPGEEFNTIVEPKHIKGSRTRFGFIIFCMAGSEDYRRLATWTNEKTPEDDFKSILSKNKPTIKMPNKSQ